MEINRFFILYLKIDSGGKLDKNFMCDPNMPFLYDFQTCGKAIEGSLYHLKNASV